ncbi:hypothetical protein ACI4A9_28180, partial [Klebsiella pneumoniae]|uniref:hypothetical protein n=1 Tax=Klebsiella pneumoniae TaxID=573 RepID=UPI0038527CCD
SPVAAQFLKNIFGSEALSGSDRWWNCLHSIASGSCRSARYRAVPSGSCLAERSSAAKSIRGAT